MSVSLNVKPLPCAYLPSSNSIQSFPKITKTSDPILIEMQSKKRIWDGIKDCFLSKSSLRNSVEKLSRTKDLSKDWKNNFTHIKQGFISEEFHLMNCHLRLILKKMNPEQLKQLFNALINTGLKDEDLKALFSCLELVSVEELENLFKEALDNGQISTEKAIQIAAKAENEYGKMVKSSAAPLMHQRRSAIAKFFHTVITTILMSLRVFDIGKEPSSNWEASSMLDSYARMFGAPLILFTALATFLSAFTALIVTAATISVLAIACFAYAKYWKRPADHIDPCKNLLLAALRGALQPVIARETEIDAALRCLASSSDNFRAHPLLVGAPGVGKTLIVNGIAQRLATGNVPECLKGKTLLVVNTAKLFSSSSPHDGNDRLQRMLDKLRPNKENYIIFFDEIQNAMKKQVEVGERLKSVFDTSIDSLPYCIGATTTQDFDKHIGSDLQIARRFQKIDINEMNEKQTLMVLKEMVNREAPDEGISEENLKLIFKASTESGEKLFQPSASMRLLSKAISHLQEGQFISSDQIDKEQELRNLYSGICREPTELSDPKITKRIGELETEIENLKTQQTPEKEHLQRVRKIKQYRSKQIRALLKSACKFCEGTADLKSKVLYKKTFLLWQFHLLPFLKSKIERMQKKFPKNMITKIDEALIAKLTVLPEKPVPVNMPKS
jgi:ATP-dependent Clp protease ATP-binding subunit ClpA